MASLAACMANGGLSPMTGKRLFSAESVRRVLPIMLTCGMYDYSGKWAYQVGVPAKSGVSGCVFLVVPNVCGIAIWSPRLDEVGNSVRGVAFARELIQRMVLHNFEIFSGHTKLNPLERRDADRQKALTEIVFAASVGDVGALEYHLAAGGDLFMGDYDDRTALHLAAAEGQLKSLKFLLDTATPEERARALALKDRWGGTALDAALGAEDDACAELLRSFGGKVGSMGDHTGIDILASAQAESAPDVGFIFAAAR